MLYFIGTLSKLQIPQIPWMENLVTKLEDGIDKTKTKISVI